VATGLSELVQTAETKPGLALCSRDDCLVQRPAAAISLQELQDLTPSHSFAKACLQGPEHNVSGKVSDIDLSDTCRNAIEIDERHFATREYQVLVVKVAVHEVSSARWYLRNAVVNGSKEPCTSLGEPFDYVNPITWIGVISQLCGR